MRLSQPIVVSGPATQPSGPATQPSGPATPASGPATQPSGPATLWRTDQPTRPAYVQDASAIESSMRALAEAHPSRARVVDIGDSLQKEHGQGGHDVLALVLGEHPDDTSRPRVLHVAGIHPRELANPAVLMEWATDLLTRAAAGDSAREAILGERTIALVPLANPDTLDIVTKGLATGDVQGTWWRGNARPGGAVDLNRNFDGRWGAGDKRPGQQNYRGTAPASEPETLALQSFGVAFQPRAVYDWHSPGGVVLEPAPRPGEAGAIDAHAAAVLVSRATGYPISSSDAHWHKAVGGTVKDWARDRLGAVSLTIETGAAHHQTDQQYADTRSRAFAALDALAASVDGHVPVPANLLALAQPPARELFVPADHLQGTVTSPVRPGHANGADD